MSKKLSVVFNPDLDQIEIEGVWYTGDLFRQFARVMPIGTPFEIVERRDGMVAIKNHECKKSKEEKPRAA